MKPAANFIGNGLAGLFGSSLIPSANGNAFGGGRVIPFATGGVIDSPIRFQLAGGYTGGWLVRPGGGDHAPGPRVEREAGCPRHQLGE